MSSTSLFKRKYRYIQDFDRNETADDSSYLGFYRIGTDEAHQPLFSGSHVKAIFPHYGFSFYDNPPGRIVQKGKGNTPSVFQSNRLMNLGLGSLLKRVDSTDMFTDDGLACYRPLSFVMAMGKAEQLATDLAFLRGAYDPGQGIWSPLDGYDWICDGAESDHETLRGNQAMYHEVFHLDTTDQAGYTDFIYLTAGTPTSLVLSHNTVLNIIHSRARNLKPLYQIPLNPDKDEKHLNDIFKMNRRLVCHTKFRGDSYPLFGIFPGLFGFKGGLLDVATGMLSGKRKDVVQFLFLLDGLALLAKRDLRYLV